MKQKDIDKEKIFIETFVKLFKEIINNNKPIRILSEEEKQLLSKDAINYLFDLKYKDYLNEEKFENIMLLSTLVSDITGEKNNFSIVLDIINFIYFLDNTDIFIPEMLEILYSGYYGNFTKDVIN